MPKVTITFQLPEDEYDYRIASKASDYYAFLCDLKEKLRSYNKHGVPNGVTTENLVEELYRDICSIDLD